MAQIEVDGVGKFNVSDKFLSMAPDEQQKAVDEFVAARQSENDPGVAEGLTRSFLGQGVALGFGDEIEAFARSLVGEETFDEELEMVQGRLDRFKETNPVLATGSEIAGAVLIPGGAARAGATLGARALRGAAAGGVTGGVFGAGTSKGDITTAEGLQERATDAAQGAGIGAITGIAAPAVIEGAVRTGRGVVNSLDRAGAPIRGAVNPEVEAARRVATARQLDNNLGQGLPEQQARIAQQAGQPVANIDLGGETTRALARSAANQSPEGRAVLDRTINDRFEGQAARVEETVNSLFPQGRLDSFTRREQLRSAARRANRPAYARAYRDGAGSLRSPELERLVSSPQMASAMRSAAQRGRDRSVAEGFGEFNPPVQLTESGVRFRRGSDGRPIFPDLRFWDFTKRELDDAANAARRAGRNEEASTIGTLAEQLRNELDRLVPSFEAARGTAQRFFQADDALEAGQNFARTGRTNLNEARDALNRMSQPERQLFAEGFADELVATVNRTGDRRNVVQRIYGSPEARNRIQLALGPQRAGRLEARLRVEGVMDLARSAVQGNSTTTRQLVELGLVGGGAGVVSGGDPTSIVASALLWRGGRRIANRQAERVARQVAELLTSGDPQAVNRAMQQVAARQGLLSGLRRFDAALAKAGSQQAVDQLNAP